MSSYNNITWWSCLKIEKNHGTASLNNNNKFTLGMLYIGVFLTRGEQMEQEGERILGSEAA